MTSAQLRAQQLSKYETQSTRERLYRTFNAALPHKSRNFYTLATNTDIIVCTVNSP